MACTKFEYVKKFEKHEEIIPQTYIVVRIDGKGFTKFCQRHKLKKPNDLRLVNLMNQCALHVMNMFKDIFLAYGQSDQYSFAFKMNTELFNRRSEKISTCLVSAFSSSFVFNWSSLFKEEILKEPPIFDGRCVTYPNLQILKDYFRWRQADCHINNLYNTTFWCLVKSGKTNTQVELILKDTHSGDKNQILFRDFGINYNKIEAVERKGSVLAYFIQEPAQKLQLEMQKKQEHVPEENNTNGEEDKNNTNGSQLSQKYEENCKEQIVKETKQNDCQKGNPLQKKKKDKTKYKLEVRHIDIIKDEFWSMIQIDDKKKKNI